MPHRMQRALWYGGPPAAWAAVLFYLGASTVIGETLPTLFPLQDKLTHFFLFGLLALLLYRGFRGGLGWAPCQAGVVAFLTTSAYGALQEGTQAFLPGRSMELLDWLADTLGAASVLLAGLVATMRAWEQST